LTRLYLIRHGETVWNAESRAQGSKNVELSRVGRNQAKLLAKRMSKFPIDRIFASDLDRAYETAAELANVLSLKVEKIADLREMNFGVWEGLTNDEIKNQYHEHYTVWRNTPHTADIPNGERLIEVQKRGLKAIYNIVENYRNQNIVVVSHGTMIKTIILGILDIDLSNFYKIKQDNGSINIIDFKTYGPVVITLNDAAHLEKTYRG